MNQVTRQVQTTEVRCAIRNLHGHHSRDVSSVGHRYINNAGQDNPSFSGATVAPQFDLYQQLRKFEVPSSILPPSFNTEAMTLSLKWRDIRDAQATEAARARLVDAVRILSNPRSI